MKEMLTLSPEAMQYFDRCEEYIRKYDSLAPTEIDFSTVVEYSFQYICYQEGQPINVLREAAVELYRLQLKETEVESSLFEVEFYDDTYREVIKVISKALETEDASFHDMVMLSVIAYVLYYEQEEREVYSEEDESQDLEGYEKQVLIELWADMVFDLHECDVKRFRRIKRLLTTCGI